MKWIDGLTVSETRDFTNLGAHWTANTDVHFFNMNREEFKHQRYDDVLHMTQSSENTQDGLGRKSNGGQGRRWQKISRVLVFGHHSR